ncbi:MAG: ABC transporter permease [Verrucomicrobiota bacterium]
MRTPDLMPWFIYIALKQLFPTGRFVSFFACVSIVGITLGVAVLLVVHAVMSGFGHEIRKGINETNGDIRIEGRRILSRWETLLEEVRQTPGVSGVTPYAHGVVMMQFQNRPAFPTVMGLDFYEDPHVIPVGDFLTVGEVEDLNDDTVFLSIGLAQQLGVGLGDTVSVYTPLMLERMKDDEILLPRDITVAGIFQSGWGQIDSSTMVLNLRLMQELYGLNYGVHGLAVRIEDRASLGEVQSALNEITPLGFNANTWLQSNRDYLSILSLEKGMMFFLMLFILLVASFSIVVTLMMSVLRKTREIGLLISMGARPRDIALGYLFQGFSMGFVGTSLGITIGVLVITFRNPIKNFLIWISQSDVAFAEFYQFADLPAHYESWSFIVIICVSMIMSTLAALIPAIRASRMNPAEALRYE